MCEVEYCEYDSKLPQQSTQSDKHRIGYSVVDIEVKVDLKWREIGMEIYCKRETLTKYNIYPGI